MKILIPALNENPLAAKALRAEGLNPTVRIVNHYTSYSKIIQEYWNAHETFIIVEHDVIPWPGALKQLWDCEEEWCGFAYPLHAQTLFGGYLGCTKFDKTLIERTPHLIYVIDNLRWMDIDGQILTLLQKITKAKHFHQHSPPVAHIRELPQIESMRQTVIQAIHPLNPEGGDS